MEMGIWISFRKRSGSSHRERKSLFVLGRKRLHQKTSESYRREAEKNASEYVSGSKDPSIILDEAEGFQTEGAEGGHRSQEPHEEEPTTGRRKHLFFLDQIDENPHEKAAEDVGQKSSEGKGAGNPFLDSGGETIS
jgi:hypothetical protein